VILNLRWDVLAWNKLNAALVRDYGALPGGTRNLLEILFAAASTMKASNFESTASRSLAKLRVDYSKSGRDPLFESLIRRLETQFPVFRRMWRAPEINVRSYGEYRIPHAEFGELVFENTAYVPDGHPAIRVVMLTPMDDRTRKAVAIAQERIAAKG
jgi:hypothetical protein